LAFLAVLAAAKNSVKKYQFYIKKMQLFYQFLRYNYIITLKNVN